MTYSNIPNIFRKKQNIKVIPILLLLTVFATSTILLENFDYVLADHGETSTTGHGPISVILSTGTNEIAFRDVDNTQVQCNTDPGPNNVCADPTSTTSFSIKTTKKGSTGTITVNDPDANLDLTAVDTVLSTATSDTSPTTKATATLTETGINTGVFSGTISLTKSPTSGSNLQTSDGDGISVFYNPIPVGAGRFFAELTGVSGTPQLQISDDTTLTTDCGGSGTFRLVTFPVNVALTPSTGTLDQITVTMSYANADLNGASANALKLLHKEFVSGGNPNPSWTDFGSTVLPGFPVTKKVQSTAQPSTVDGQYALGTNVGSCGGGGGGLVRPGLVVNALAGINSLRFIAHSSSSSGGFTSTSSTTEQETNSIISNPEPGPVQQSVIPEPVLVETPESNEEKQTAIPIWVKNNAGWYADDQIDDQNFVAGLQYMITENIIKVPKIEDGYAKVQSEKVPSWIKDVAGFWADDGIDDETFTQALQWLISNGVVKVPT